MSVSDSFYFSHRCNFDFMFCSCALLLVRFPDKEVGQYPMAYVVRKSASNLSENAVMDFIAKLVSFFFLCKCKSQTLLLPLT